MKFLLLSFLLLLAIPMVSAQTDISFDVKTTNYATGKKESGVAVKLYQGSSVLQTLTSDGSGEVHLKIPSGKKYKIEVSKAGKVMRFITLDLTNIDPELLMGNATPQGSVQISLFDQLPNVDYSYVTSNSITEFFFDGKNPQLQYDTILAEKMLKKIEKIMKDAESQKGQADAQYNAAIKQADALYTQKKYAEALTAYEQALGFKPAEKHPAERIMEIDGILKAQKANANESAQAEQEYQALITSANTLRDQKKYEEAIARYKEAIIKKSEQYPKDQIALLEAEIVKQKKDAENAQKYTDAIKAADGFFGQKSFQAAKDKYKEALKYKAGDAHATARLAEIDGKLNAQKADQEKKAKYEAANAAGDALMGQEKWAEAKAKYNEALTLEPGATYPTEKIKEADGKLAEIEKEKAKQDQIAKLLAEGNTAFTGSQWVPAKAKYQEVLKLDAANAVATGRIAEIETKLNEEKADAEKLAKIKQLVTEGDNLAKATKLEEAKAKYTEALALRPDPAIQTKIAALDAQIAAAAQKADQKVKYDKAMADGETAFAASKWEDAKASFQAALAIDPAQALPKQRITEADKKIAEGVANAQKAEKYQAALAAGNTALGAKDLAGAKAKYQEAIALDNTKPEAKEKLAEVEKLLGDQLKAQQNQAKYDAAIKAGGDLLAASKLTEAKAKFQEAATLDPTQALPKQKIDEIDGLLANAEKQKQVEQLLKAGDAALAKKDLATARSSYQQVLTIDAANTVAPAKLQEVAKIENELAGAAQKEARFKELKDEATALMAQAKYTEAKQKLNETKTIKTDAGVDQLIKECDAKLAEIAKNAEAEKQYNALVAEAQGLESGKKYDEAIAKYNEALKVKNEQLPKDRIAAIAKLKEGDANQAKYDAAVKAGSDLLAASKLTEAKAKFLEASAIDPAQQLPKQKIAEIDNLLGAAEKQKQIDQLIKDGDAALTKKDLATARSKYQQAITADPANTIAPAKLQEVAKLENELAGEAQKEARFKQLKDEATALMAQAKYQEAKQKLNETKTIKTDAGVDQLIKECDAKLADLAKGAETDKQYNALVAEAQGLESGKKYDEAIAKYNEALKVKNEQLPKDRIAAINQAKANMANQAKVDADYAAAMKKGNDAFNGENYLDAIKFYNEALALKPTEKEPADKAAEAQRLESAKTAGSEQAAYNKILEVAQKAMDEKNYTKASEMYNRALSLRSSDPLPKQRLSEIAALLKADEDAKQKQAAYTKKVGEAETAATGGKLEEAITLFGQAKTIKPDETLPDNRIAELRAVLEGKNAAAAGLEAQYKDLFSQGNNAAAGKDYQTALAKYKEALAVKPNDKPALDKIAEMNQVLDNMAKVDKQKAAIDKMIAKADAEFDNKKWSDAKAAYEKVLAADPTNGYAVERVRLCDVELKKEGEREIQLQYQKVLTKANENFDIKNYDKAKEFYNRAIGLKPSDPYPKKRLREIDAILNPAPVAIAPVSTEPQPLDPLGVPTDNSIVEGNEKLQKAELSRKNNRVNRFRKKTEESENLSGELAVKQEGTTTATNQELDNVRKTVRTDDEESEAKRQELVQNVSTHEQKITSDAMETDRFENAEHHDAKGQIVLADQLANEKKAVLDLGASSNDSLLIIQRTNISTQDNSDARNQYTSRVDNDVTYAKVKVGMEAKSNLDDTEQRERMEETVLVGGRSVSAADDQQSTRTYEALRVVEDEIEVAHQGMVVKETKDSEAPSANRDLVVEMETAVTGQREQSEEQHLETTLESRKGIEQSEIDIAASTKADDDKRQANVVVIDSKQQNQFEMERQDYNAMVVKSMTNDGTLQKETVKNDRFDELAVNSVRANTEATKVNAKKYEADNNAASLTQQDNHLNTQGELSNTKVTIEANTISDDKKIMDNNNVLKSKEVSLSQGNDKQGQAQVDKNQAARQTIAASEKKEPAVAVKAENDLGKLYPEGVSQEQFDQNDQDGLVSAVITRRVVVKDGHGDLYIRTQMLSGVTYSKNGQPTTEYVWQRETQDAKLKRNY